MSDAPTFVKGIGPPIEQLREDAVEGLTLPGTEPRAIQDTIALIDEVLRLHAVIQRIGESGRNSLVQAFVAKQAAEERSRLLERERDEALALAARVRRQHDIVMDAIKTRGLPNGQTEWRDENYSTWELWLGPTVECPACAFTFGADHTDDKGGGYTCPACAQEAAEATVRLQAEALSAARVWVLDAQREGTLHGSTAQYEAAAEVLVQIDSVLTVSEAGRAEPPEDAWVPTYEQVSARDPIRIPVAARKLLAALDVMYDRGHLSINAREAMEGLRLLVAPAAVAPSETPHCEYGCDHGVLTFDEVDEHGERTSDQYQEPCPDCHGVPTTEETTG